MIRRIGAFPVAWGKRLILVLLILILYGEALLFYCHIQPEPSSAVFLSGIYPEGSRAEQLLKSMEQADGNSALFFWDGGMETLTEPEYGRTVQTMVGGIFGDGGLYDRRLAGLLRNDREGCVIDRESAIALFGTGQAEGRILICQGKRYQVRKVLPWKQRMLLIHPSDDSVVCTRVFIKKQDSGGGKTTEQLLMSYGLSGTAVEGEFLRVPAVASLMLFPAAVFFSLFRWALRERKGYREKEPGYWIWTAAAILLAVTALVFLWEKVRIPGDWIPSRWSDFLFWREKLEAMRENIRLFWMLPKTVLQAENISACIGTVIFSVSACFLFIVIRKKMCYTVYSMYFSGEKKKENAV